MLYPKGKVTLSLVSVKVKLNSELVVSLSKPNQVVSVPKPDHVILVSEPNQVVLVCKPKLLFTFLGMRMRMPLPPPSVSGISSTLSMPRCPPFQSLLPYLCGHCNNMYVQT